MFPSIRPAFLYNSQKHYIYWICVSYIQYRIYNTYNIYQICASYDVGKCPSNAIHRTDKALKICLLKSFFLYVSNKILMKLSFHKSQVIVVVEEMLRMFLIYDAQAPKKYDLCNAISGKFMAISVPRGKFIVRNVHCEQRMFTIKESLRKDKFIEKGIGERLCFPTCLINGQEIRS